jgi:hypothetical protein
VHQRDELISLLGKKIFHEVDVEFFKGTPPVLAKYISSPMTLQTRYKGRILKARVRRDGSIRLKGKVYSSPSEAGAAACKWHTCNGWTFWK